MSRFFFIVVCLGLIMNRCAGERFACTSFLDYELRFTTLTNEVVHYYAKETNYNQLIIPEISMKPQNIEIVIVNQDKNHVTIKSKTKTFLFKGEKAQRLRMWIEKESLQLDRFIQFIFNRNNNNYGKR